MKTAQKFLLAALSVISITVIIYSCEEIKDAIDDYNSDDTCPEHIFAKPVSDQFIIKFEKFDNYDRQSVYINKIADSVKADSFAVETCDCDPKLILVTFYSSSGIDMENIRGTIRSKLEDEGNGTYNYTFEQPVDGNTYSNTYYNKPAEYSIRPAMVAIIDGGIKGDKVNVKPNPDLSHDFTGESDSNPAVTINSHGTYVAQLATENLPPDKIQLMDLRIFKKDGTGTLFNGLCAISYAIQKDANVINLSWGSYFKDVDTLFLNYIREAKINDITIITSAGNDSIDTDHCLHFPSGFNSPVFGTLGNVLGVASLNNTEDGLAYYSNFGLTSLGIAAPQGKIDGNIFEGTSFSAPLVTNHVIQMLIKDPSQTNVGIVNCITNSAITIPGLKVISEGKLDPTVLNCP